MAILNSIVNNTVDTAKTFLLGDVRSQSLNVDTYRSKFMGTNARAYLFVCKVRFPGLQTILSSGIQAALANPVDMLSRGLVGAAGAAIRTGGSSIGTEDFKYFVKSTSLPESSLEETTTHWAGQQFKMSSVRRSMDWMVTFLVNDDASVIKRFWNWHLIMQNPEANSYGKPSEYMADQVVQLLGLDGYPICTYKLYGAWPKSIGATNLDYSSNEFATVDITFAYQYHTVTQSEEPGLATGARSAVRSLIGSL